MFPSISVKSHADAVAKGLSALEYDQLPYALARTVTALAKQAQAAEKKAIPGVFDNPVPFTVNSVAVMPARKGLPIATVFIKDKAAQYLTPYEFGGTQFLGEKPADLVPVNAQPNKYGFLPRGSVKQLLARPDCFRAKLKTASGEEIDGVWQRPTPVNAPRVKGRGKQDKYQNTTGKLRLLVAFHAPVQTKKRLNFGARAQQVVTMNFNGEFDANLRRAVATAKV